MLGAEILGGALGASAPGAFILSSSPRFLKLPSRAWSSSMPSRLQGGFLRDTWNYFQLLGTIFPKKQQNHIH